MAGAMLAMGLLLAGAVVAVVLLEFDRLDEVGRTVAIAGLTFLAGIGFWAYAQTIRTMGEPGVAPSSARAPRPDVARPSRTDRPERSEPGEESLAQKQDDPEPSQRSETANGGTKQGQATATPDPQKEEASEERDEGATVSEGTSATEPESVISEPDALDPSAFHDSVAEAWRQYLRNGDGHFNAAGFQRQLSASGLQLSVTDGARVRAGETVLLVEDATRPAGRFLVVPSFVKSPRAAPDWFEDVGDGALTRRTRKVHRLGEGEWTEAGFKIIGKGSIK